MEPGLWLHSVLIFLTMMVSVLLCLSLFLSLESGSEGPALQYGCSSLEASGTLLLLFPCGPSLMLSVYILGEISVQINCQFLIGLFVCFLLHCISFRIFWILTPYRVYHLPEKTYSKNISRTDVRVCTACVFFGFLCFTLQSSSFTCSVSFRRRAEWFSNICIYSFSGSFPL